MQFKIFGDKAKAVKEGDMFRVTDVYTVEGHMVAKLETVE